jgi:hypothetical protein
MEMELDEEKKKESEWDSYLLRKDVASWRFYRWIKRNATSLLQRGISADNAKEFADLMQNAGFRWLPEKSAAGQGSRGGTDYDFLLQKLEEARLVRPLQPPKPAPKPEHERRLELQYVLKLHPQGAPDKVLGKFSGAEVIRKIKSLAAGGNQSQFSIIRDDGAAVDMDLSPVVDSPLAQAQSQNQPVVAYQQPVGRFHAEVLEQEYKKFFDTNTTSAVKSRANRDKGFRDWLNRNIQQEWVQASSGSVGGEPKRL